MAGPLITVLFFCLISAAEDPPITAHPGDDVTLPCKAPNNVNIAAVEWIRSHFKESVYLKIDGHLNTADQDPSYVNRVQLKDDEMKNGELSLILKNVTNNDEGIYECRYLEWSGGRRKRSLISGEPISIVQLIVTGGESESGKLSESGKHREDGKDKRGRLGIILPVSLIATLVVALVGLVGFMIFKKLKGRSEEKPILPVDDPDVLQQLQEN